MESESEGDAPWQAGPASPTWREQPGAAIVRGPLLACAVAVLAARPAAGPAQAFLQLLLGPPNTARPGGLLLGIFDPADELVAGQWRDVVPGIECRRVGLQRLTQVRGQFMYHPTGDSLAAHRSIVTSPGSAPRIASAPDETQEPFAAGSALSLPRESSTERGDDSPLLR